MTERETLLQAAIAACFKNHEAVTPAAVRSHLPEDFFYDDTGDAMTEAEVFAEIQAFYKTVTKPPLAINTLPDGRALVQDVIPDSQELLGDEDDDLRDTWSPETVTMPVEAAPVAKEASASHGASGPGFSPQARLNECYRREGDLVGARNRLQAEHRSAREALEAAKQAWQRHDPNRQTPEQAAAEFRAQSQRDRAARVNGAYRVTPTAPAPRGEIAYVDLERQYSQGGDGNSFVRSRARTLNRRGAYSKQEAARAGFVNRDDRRGAVPAPVVVAKPTIPALGK